MYRAIVKCIFDTHLDCVEIEGSSWVTILPETSTSPHTLKIPLLSTESGFVASGTKVAEWRINQSVNDDFFYIFLYLDENAVKGDVPLMFKVSNSDFLVDSETLKSRLAKRFGELAPQLELK